MVVSTAEVQNEKIDGDYKHPDGEDEAGFSDPFSSNQEPEGQETGMMVNQRGIRLVCDHSELMAVRL